MVPGSALIISGGATCGPQGTDDGTGADEEEEEEAAGGEIVCSASCENPTVPPSVDVN